MGGSPDPVVAVCDYVGNERVVALYYQLYRYRLVVCGVPMTEYSDQEMGAYARLCAKRAKSIGEIAQMMGKTEDEVHRLMEVAGGCRCGSGYEPRWFYDARGIELFKGCDKCSPAKLKQYRPEVLTNPNYYADEPIEPEDY
jgi:hypothetical protein